MGIGRLMVAEALPGVAVGVEGLAGGVVSGAWGVTATALEGVDGLPEVSTAITRYEYEVPLVSPVSVCGHVVKPVFTEA